MVKTKIIRSLRNKHIRDQDGLKLCHFVESTSQTKTRIIVNSEFSSNLPFIHRTSVRGHFACVRKFVSENLMGFGGRSTAALIEPIVGECYFHVPTHCKSFDGKRITRPTCFSVTLSYSLDVAGGSSGYEDRIGSGNEAEEHAANQRSPDCRQQAHHQRFECGISGRR